MKKRKLGAHGPEVSAIGFGAMSFGGFYGETDLDESFACLDAAWEMGIDFLDVANIYGPYTSEEVVGKWQKDRGLTFKVATKGGIVIGAPRGTVDNSEGYIREMLEASLTRLQMDRVELYYMHRRDPSLPIETITEMLVKLQEEGLIGHFGFSEIAPATLRAAAKVAPVAAVQSEYSIWTRLPELGMIQACEELGTAFVPFSPLGRGILSDTALDPATFTTKDIRKTNPRFQPEAFAHNMGPVRALRDFAHANGWTTAAVALAWTLQTSAINIPIPGTRTAAHVNEWKGADEIVFTPEQWEELDAIMPAGWALGDRYSYEQLLGIERYC